MSIILLNVLKIEARQRNMSLPIHAVITHKIISMVCLNLYYFPQLAHFMTTRIMNM